MRKFVIGVFVLVIHVVFAQQNKQWKGYFSYNSIKDISESGNKIYAASENALFNKKLDANQIETISTIEGLLGERISALYYSPTFHKTIVGFETGLMVVINETDGKITNVVDIINKNLPANIKKINHFMEYDGIVYVSCDFGIVQYNLQTLEFGDTYFIGPNGKEVIVYQTTLFDGDIYAVTQNDGIRKALITNPNLIDYNQWQVFDAGFWNGIVTIENQLIGMNLDNQLYLFNSFGGATPFGDLGNTGLDLRATEGYLIACTRNKVLIYNNSLNLIVQIQSSQVPNFQSDFTCATVINENIIIGTKEDGIVYSQISNPLNFEFILPEGPHRNNIFSLNASTSNVWAVYGDYDLFYNPFPLDQYGISKYSENGWEYIPYSDVFNAECLSKITINPKNENQVFVSSFHKGLIRLDNGEPSILYNQNNSGLESLTFDGNNISVRINGAVFDKSGDLWITNSLIKNSLKVLKANGQWASYNMEKTITNIKQNNLNKIVIDKSGTKWMATYIDGVIAFNEKNNVFKKISEGNDSGNLPNRDVRAIAIDNRSQVWIGTSKGLRVLSNSGSYFNSGQMKANPIIILEDGLAQELLYEQFITDIEVNGSNEKWIGTVDSGVFLFSSDGQQTIYHFTKDNSPLPSNVINDIDINPNTGEVFFATDKGMVSFLGTATSPADSLKDVYIYPNPVRPEFTGTVKISGLISKANIKITDIEGNLVYETTSEGGTIEWDTTAFGKYKVASGVYMVFIAADDGSETTVKKVMIIR